MISLDLLSTSLEEDFLVVKISLLMIYLVSQDSHLEEAKVEDLKIFFQIYLEEAEEVILVQKEGLIFKLKWR